MPVLALPTRRRRGREQEEEEENPMRIEFSDLGTNVEVTLYENLDGTDVLFDRCYTSDHKGGLHFDGDHGAAIEVRGLFQWAEESWAKPAISVARTCGEKKTFLNFPLAKFATNCYSRF